MKRLLMIMAILAMANTASAVEIPTPKLGDSLPVVFQPNGNMNAPNGIYARRMTPGRLQAERTQFSMICEGQHGQMSYDPNCW